MVWRASHQLYVAGSALEIDRELVTILASMYVLRSYQSQRFGVENLRTVNIMYHY